MQNFHGGLSRLRQCHLKPSQNPKYHLQWLCKPLSYLQTRMHMHKRDYHCDTIQIEVKTELLEIEIDGQCFFGKSI